MKRIGWLLFILGVLYFIFLIRQDIIDHLDLRKELQMVSRKTEQEESASLRLIDRSRRLKSNEFIEELARTRLGLIKKGETAYKVFR